LDDDREGDDMNLLLYTWNPDAIKGEGAYEYYQSLQTNTDLSVNTAFYIKNLVASDFRLFRLDMVTYNSSYNLFSFIRLDFIMHPTGLIEPELVIYTMNVDCYADTDSMARAVFEVIFILLVLLYTAIEIFNIKG
jgi:hypothetical protein